MSDDRALALSLLSTKAVRARTRLLYEAGLAGQLTHFHVHPEKLPALADYVLETIRLNYPSLAIPFHARWRHFVSAGQDLWGEIDSAQSWKSPNHRGRAAYDLAITSVLLDAGAGADWRYTDAKTGLVSSRSEGLGIASLRMFESGLFSSDPSDPLRADAERLAALTADEIAKGFQVSGDNPMVGLEGRASLLRRLGEAVLANTAAFAKSDKPRPGGLYDALVAQASDRALPAASILETLLLNLGPIWPGRTTLGGLSLGDCWHHPLIKTADASNGLVPFHKLSQWMAYSLIEPLEWTGYTVTDIDGLTGLPEYRNGGLFLDGGVISLKNADDANRAHEPGSQIVVEWRALTVALLDEIAIHIRRGLGMDAQSLPLARILEGGTWSAGRRIAREKREGGGPPLSIVSDGTVF
ncbi:MAG: URC4/urg3 family protein [Beijerinckiaceae bacterium]